MSSAEPTSDVAGSSSSRIVPAAPNGGHHDEPVHVEAGGLHTSLTLAALFANHDLSARLNTMLRTTPLGAFTLGEFLRDRDGVIAWMLRQQNCGRRTANELATLIDSDPQPVAPPPPPPPEPPLAETKLTDLLAADVLSTRLAQVLRSTELGATTLPEFLRSRSRMESKMLRIPNCGRRSVTELRSLVGMHARRQIEEQGLNPAVFGEDFTALLQAAPGVTPDRDRPPPACDLWMLITWHLGRLPERTADVIRLRFGLGDAPPMTLAEIGEEYGVTRERIRQIEAKGLKTVLAACRRFPLRPFVDEAKPFLLNAVFGPGIHVSAGAAERAIAALDGWHELALALVHGGGATWLRRHAMKLGCGWLAPGADAGEIKSIAADLKRRAKGRSFPRAVDELADGIDPRLAAAAMELLLDWRAEAGYAFPRRPGTRLRRTVRLHALLAREPQPLELPPLLQRYHAAVPADPCTDRDLVIVMEAASHLFLEIQEGCWTSIGRGADAEPADPPAAPDANAAPVPKPIAVDEGTIATALERELERAGPLRLGELMGRAIDILPEGRSRHSVGPTLLLSPTRFVRVLPGVYALPSQVLDGRDLVQAGAIDYLLNPTQARFYAVGRKAGEAWGAYPLWTPTAEMRLCRWARAGDDRALLRSLLDVASIDEWPTDEADKEVWRELRSRDGRYELWSERRATATRPPVDRVLAAAIRLARNGSIGWVFANRIMGYPPSSYAGAGLLAGMVAAGMAVEPAVESGWQLPHRPGLRLVDWVDRLSEDLHATGEIGWEHGAGADLASVFSTVASGGEPVDEPEMDEYDQIMAQHRLSVQARRIEARMAVEAE